MNLKIWIYWIAAVIFGVAVTVMSKVHYGGSIYSSVEETYLKEARCYDLLTFIAVVIIMYIILTVGECFIFKKISTNATFKNKTKFLVTIFLINFIVWIPYYLAHYPGGVYSDTLSSIGMAINGSIDNHHPVLYTMLLKGVIKFSGLLGQDLNWAIGLFTAIQMFAMECVIIYFANWLMKYRVNKIVICICVAYLIFFPLIPLQAISVWKDTPFSIAIFLYTLSCVDLYFENKNAKVNCKLLIWHFICLLLVAFTRNNGIYIIIGTSVFNLIFSFRRYICKKYRNMLCIICSLGIGLTLFIQGPVYKYYNIISGEFVENLGVPLQQIGRVVAYEGNITEEQKKRLDSYIPYEIVAEKYAPGVVDNLKWNEAFSDEYMEENKVEFFKLWFELFLQNPEEYVKAYILQTAGFWCLNVAGFEAYIQNWVWPNDAGIEQTDYMQQIFEIPFQQLVSPKKPISSAVFFWILFLCIIVSIKRFGIKVSCLYMPLFLVWLTVMIATPVTVSMRYVQPLVFALPVYIALPIVIEKCKE